MNEILVEIGKQSPLIMTLGYWIWNLMSEKKAMTERSNTKEDKQSEDDKALWERVLTTMTTVTSALTSTQADHATMKEHLNIMRTDIELIKTKVNEQS